MPKTPFINPCIYNDEVGCGLDADCAHCGWNPEVAAKRVKAQKDTLKKAKFPGEKLYRIPFTGYCEVWADSPEEAVDHAGDEQMFFVRYEFGEPTCLEKEEDNGVDC